MKTVLVVDDDPEILDLLNSYFNSLGYNVLIGGTATEAMGLLLANTVHIIFLDIVMDEKDGITFMKEIKQLDPKIPVVIMTGYKEADRVIEAFRAGAIDCLLKPFNFEYIKASIMDVYAPKD